MQEYEEERDSCFMCHEAQVHRTDRWKFELVEEDDESNSDEFWLCRTCHGHFDGIEEFDKFRVDAKRIMLYRSAARLQKFLLLNAPDSIIQSAIQGMLMRVTYDNEGNVDARFRDGLISRLSDSTKEE